MGVGSRPTGVGSKSSGDGVSGRRKLSVVRVIGLLMISATAASRSSGSATVVASCVPTFNPSGGIPYSARICSETTR